MGTGITKTTRRPGILRMWQGIVGFLRWFWNTDFRKRRISWTRFKEKRLTWKGFLTFDLNARIRTYVYLGIGFLCFAPFARPWTVANIHRVACQCIENASLPSLGWFTAYAEQCFQVTALRKSLIKHYDRDGDRKISPQEARRLNLETGLAANDLAAPCYEADFDRLLAAAHRRRLLPERITREVRDPYRLSPRTLARQLRRLNWEKGEKECQRQHEAMWRDADPYLDYRWARPGDYLKLATWRRGALRFCYGGLYLAWDTWRVFVGIGNRLSEPLAIYAVALALLAVSTIALRRHHRDLFWALAGVFGVLGGICSFWLGFSTIGLVGLPWLWASVPLSIADGGLFLWLELAWFKAVVGLTESDMWIRKGQPS